jgi:hypothetical protein
MQETYDFGIATAITLFEKQDAVESVVSRGR